MHDPQPFGFSSFLQQTDAVGIFVLVLLLCMSVASWAVIVFKGLR